MVEKILVIDDDPDTIEFLTLILTRQGYEVHAAKDGMDALGQAHDLMPDLIILDIMMPGLDGYEVARSLRRHPETALTPILMFTAKTQVEDKLAGYEAGVDIYLTKPVHPVELQANIKALMVQKKARTDMLTEHGYIVGVLGTKGGLGVSTIALNLAIAYHQKFNINVIAAEMRPGQGSWGQELDMVGPKGLVDLLNRNQSEITADAIDNLLVSTSFGVRLLLSSDNSADVPYANAIAQFETTLEQLSVLAPLVVLDIGTNFHPAYDALARLCNEIILVTEPQPITVHRTRLMVDELRNFGFGSGKALTVIAVHRSRAEISLSVSKIEEALKCPVALGIPPAVELAYLSSTRYLPMVILQPEGIFAKQLGELAEHLSHRVAA